jgi:D-3-phosphoglycerate dehydrogenase
VKAIMPNDPNYQPFDYEQERLSALGVEVVFSELDEAAIRRLAAGAEILFNTGTALTRETVASLSKCQLIVFYGTGADGLDVAAATELGILVATTPVFSEEVADHALAMLLAFSRRLTDVDRAVRRVDWNWGPFRQLRSLSSQTVGVIGFGRIGQALARRLHPLGCRIIYYDPYVLAAPVPYAEPNSLDTLLRTSDYITIHAPLAADTARLLGEAELRLMKPTAYVINAARGAIVDEQALVRALTEHWIAGAGLDVFTVEPVPHGHPLLTLPNVLLSPHMAGYTVDSFQRMRQTACDSVECLLNHEWPPYIANPHVQPRTGPLR